MDRRIFLASALLITATPLRAEEGHPAAPAGGDAKPQASSPQASPQRTDPPQADPPEVARSLDAVLSGLLDKAGELEALETVLVARRGEILAERGYRGHSPTRPTNIKSASKSVMSALVGIAIDRRILEGPDQAIAPLLLRDLPGDPDPRLARVTIGHLLSMQAGLGRTSGPNYGRWVASRNWVRYALEQDFDDEPGGAMLYSTGSTHLLSAILTRVTGRSTLALAQEWMKPVEGFAIASWARDPQGIYLGGNQMAMTPRALLAFGELYRNRGRNRAGATVISEGWIDQSWTPRTASRFTGDAYGYGWFLRRMAGQDVRYAWGYGGQMLYIVPALGLSVVMTSDEGNPSARTGYRDQLNGLMQSIIMAVGDGGGDRDG
ncbi:MULTISPECIES: serine hydrolase [unclassified Chelatococcus]|uniref:serine hydrolase domain-containing protein n=1 Tax=unclassified Chelatococcus TaxID=2638111 RepID=UPI001BD00104|nr:MULTISPECIES: serine hydrolase [unclassified Chelatococcus]CAH1662924.1 6-aminohexanoate-dimer hydrolase [Hyphomicrobiales bacterium]MBS7741501.1 serine hydrolase [Chelatococcus sp. HY11]MBX3544480.1 serine hydrolase [Chelatococcus sp.]MCO5078997.1 beta-lactamase family protein [Chelatococcus sp.]CAH1682469.1 6-aminohexanoate-dimer hydrolase [Hyphomicrobiales bacterium]